MSDQPEPTVTPRPYGTRAEHLAWCKLRALQYVDAGNAQEALASMFSDLGKHDELRNHLALELGALLMLNGHLQTARQVSAFIEGVN